MSRIMPQRRNDLTLQELDGEAVLYDARCGAVHRFDAMALFIWEGSNGTAGVYDITRGLSERFAVDEAHARDVVEVAVAEFEARDLLASGWERETRAGAADRTPSATTTAERFTADAKVSGGGAAGRSRGLTRREAVRGGLTRLLLAGPVVSTFFATPAYGSGISPHGPGGCKNIGFSCTVNNECCEGGTDTACQDQGGPAKTCCVQHNRPGCTIDNDCCNQGDVCNAGTCQ